MCAQRGRVQLIRNQGYAMCPGRADAGRADCRGCLLGSQGTTLPPGAFEELVAPLRRELLVHAYRLLGSTADAEDALQEAMIAGWRGVDALRDRSALRAWMYRVTTNAALRIAERRGPRVLSWERESARSPYGEVGEPALGPWVTPFQDPDPSAVVLRREHIELAWIAAIQRLPALQRAALCSKTR